MMILKVTTIGDKTYVLTAGYACSAKASNHQLDITQSMLENCKGDMAVYTGSSDMENWNIAHHGIKVTRSKALELFPVIPDETYLRR